MNNIYEQYHVCVCWEKQNIHKHKLMNNAVISFLTFNTALGQLLNSQSDLVPLWFDMCQCFLSSPRPPWATSPKEWNFLHFQCVLSWTQKPQVVHKKQKKLKSWCGKPVEAHSVIRVHWHILYLLKSRASLQTIVSFSMILENLSPWEYWAHKTGWNVLHLLGFTYLNKGRKAAEGLDVLIESGWCAITHQDGP